MVAQRRVTFSREGSRRIYEPSSIHLRTTCPLTESFLERRHPAGIAARGPLEGEEGGSGHRKILVYESLIPYRLISVAHRSMIITSYHPSFS
jgi:hypothetical protein